MNLHQINISAEWVAAGETGAFPTMLGVDMDPSEARGLQGCLFFVFPELEVDGVRIFDVEGVIDWLALLHHRIPHLMYFLPWGPEAGSLEGLLWTLVPPERRDEVRQGGAFPLTEEMLGELAEHAAACAGFAVSKGDDWEVIVTRFLEDRKSTRLNSSH